jgi:caffeoyl-CoA O-methyltransferase
LGRRAHSIDAAREQVSNRAMPKATGINPEIYRYIVDHRSAADDPLLKALRAETRERFGGDAGMQIAPDQGSLLRILAAAIGARRAVEVGTFTGYSSLEIARGLGPGGHLLACDVSEEWTALARSYWAKAGVDDRIELALGPAVQTLRALPDEPCFDFAFIDADKENYGTYYEEILRRLRPGGLLAVDNVLWGGSVLDPNRDDVSVRAIRALNERILRDERVESVMLAVADGLNLVRKR